MKRSQTHSSENLPSFDLPVENELLILKLKAEFGAECSAGHENIPPDIVNDIVNEFLRSVYDFENRFRKEHPTIKLFEKLERPFFKKADSIPDSLIKHELIRLTKILNRHKIALDVLGEDPDRQIYKFITEEFFHEEIDVPDIEGYTLHYCYEDFHPNYELEIRQRSMEFILQWFHRQLGEYSWQLADPFIHPDGREFPKEYVLKKIRNVYDAYVLYSDCSYVISDIQFDWNDAKQSGRGVVTGNVKYNAQTESGESIEHEGPFEFYLSSAGAWWSIFYFVFPGFAW
jgi:hypothetical protein